MNTLTQIKLRTLQFHTQMGSFEVDMEMYDGSEYGPAEKLQEGGGVYLNERIYLQLTMFDPLQRNEIVLSVQGLGFDFLLKVLQLQSLECSLSKTFQSPATLLTRQTSPK